MEKLIKEVLKNAREKWGTKHILTMLPSSGQLKCTKCGVVYVLWSEKDIMETECLYFRGKLIDLIDRDL